MLRRRGHRPPVPGAGGARAVPRPQGQGRLCPLPDLEPRRGRVPGFSRSGRHAAVPARRQERGHELEREQQLRPGHRRHLSHRDRGGARGSAEPAAPHPGRRQAGRRSGVGREGGPGRRRRGQLPGQRLARHSVRLEGRRLRPGGTGCHAAAPRRDHPAPRAHGLIHPRSSRGARRTYEFVPSSIQWWRGDRKVPRHCYVYKTKVGITVGIL